MHATPLVRPSASDRRGFTLIELLTVIAIIGILAAILVPVVSKVRDTARNATCQSNLRQIGLAAHLYAQESGSFPPGLNESGVPWHRHMRPYFAGGSTTVDNHNLNSAVVVCPSRTLIPADDQLNRSSYSVHPLLMPAMNESARRLVKPGAVARPGELILAADGTQQSHGGANAQFYSVPGAGSATPSTSLDNVIEDGPDTDGSSPAWLRFRHSGKTNIVYADGHVGALAKGAVKERNVRLY